MTSAVASRARWVVGGASRAIERAQGVPAWVITPAMLGGAALVIAVAGLFWDVAYHIDHGRDVNLFSVPHLMILAGLTGLAATAAVAVAFATVDGRGGWAVGPLRVPHFTLPLLLTAAGAGLGFPLDDLWHRTYGIDVTLWSPTHLLMVGGAVFSTFALALVPAEGALHSRGRLPRWRRVSLCGAGAVGLSVLTLEFDFGIPQWQAVYHPLIVVAGLTLALTAARAALGRGGALAAALFFLLIRGGLALLLGTTLQHTAPGLPLALGMAACVEVGFRLTRERAPIATALVTGGLAATAGFASEWAWQAATGRLPWHAGPQMLWMPAAGAMAAALVGLAAGRVQAGERAGIPGGVLLAALAGIGLLVALPLPRAAAPTTAEITTTPTGAARSAVDRFGVPARVQDVQVDVWLSDPAAARDADWFMVMAWQGGGARDVPLNEIAPGHYRAAGPVPTGGSWKSMVFLARGAVVAGAPVSFPADPDSRFGGYPVQPDRSEPMGPASRLLLTETHAGPGFVAAAAQAALLFTVLLWIGGLLAAYRAVAAARRA